MGKKNIVVRGPVITQSGYGVHSRQLAEWLLGLEEKRDDIEITFDTVPWGITPWYVDADACDGLIGKMLSKTQKKDSYDVSFQLQLPNEWNPFLAKYNVGMTAAVETDRCNPTWVEAVNKMDLVIVPSEFTKSVLENSGEVKTTICVVPESWISECETATEENCALVDNLKLDTEFNFLLVAQFTGNNPENDRKNIAYTVKWMMEEFKDNEKVGLVIKTNFGRNTNLDRRNVLQTISQLVLECRQGIGPRIHVVHGHMTNKEMVGLYTHPKIKALVNLTRGEGFGLPILEAATCGLPVIATDWSAHTEFLKQGKYVKIDYNIHDIHPSRVDNQIFMKDAKWANPLEEDFKRKITRFYKNSRIPKEWALDLQKKLLKSHSPAEIRNQYDGILTHLDL